MRGRGGLALDATQCRAFPRSASREVFPRINFGFSQGHYQMCSLEHNALPSVTQRVHIAAVRRAIVQNSVVADGYVIVERLR